jgi:hypothetical protein
MIIELVFRAIIIHEVTRVFVRKQALQNEKNMNICTQVNLRLHRPVCCYQIDQRVTLFYRQLIQIIRTLDLL